ncbi:alkaline phosphatase family protein [Thermogutta sp.]|uniref:alkaline phosphatase family protein n=1 Tax=Thermogutta sp. TaxID=1962930 RepID=UPI0032207EF8
MRRFVRPLVLVALGLMLLWGHPVLAEESGKAAKPQNIILIGWDGAQRAHVMECLQRGELPNLQQLAKEGALVNIDVVTGATDTKAGWTQILTGYNPEVTGVYSNGRYRDVPKGLSVFERLKEHFGPDFVCVAVIGKREHCGEIREPFKRQITDEEAAKIQSQREAQAKQQAQARQQGQQKQQAQPGQAGQRRAQQKAGQPAQPGAGRQVIGRVVEENGVKYLVFEGSPYYTMHKACDVWEYGLMEDEKVGSRAIELLEKYRDKPFFFFVHFASVDHQGHRFGENSKEYNDALISNDAWLGKIVEKLKELGLYDKTLIYVTADHGFNEGTTNHSYAPYVFLATNDPLVKRDGMRQDIAPTILARFGVDLSKLQPPLDGEPLTQPATKPVLKAPETPPARAQGVRAQRRGGQRRAQQGQAAPATQAP